MFRNEHGGHLDRGAAAVEMALVLPLLLLVLFGLVDFGRAFNNQMQLTQAAREGVRVVAMGNPGDAGDRVFAALDPKLRASVTTKVVTPCSAGDTTTNAEVLVTYQFKFMTPLGPIAGIFGASTLPRVGTVKPLTSSGVMRCSG
jgi:Flp pilus assembly protein TadG